MFPNQPTPTPPGPPSNQPGGPFGQQPMGLGSGMEGGWIQKLRELYQQALQWVDANAFPAMQGGMNYLGNGATNALNGVPDYGPQLREGILNGIIQGGQAVNPGGLGTFTNQPTPTPSGRGPGLQSVVPPGSPMGGRMGGSPGKVPLHKRPAGRIVGRYPSFRGGAGVQSGY